VFHFYSFRGANTNAIKNIVGRVGVTLNQVIQHSIVLVLISGHSCMMQPLPESRASGARLFFDIESMRVKQDGRWVHKPTLIVALKACPDCSHIFPRNWKEAEKLPDCKSCGKRFHSWDILDEKNREKNIAVEFTRWLYSDENKGATALAHNLRGLVQLSFHDLLDSRYDGQFILSSLFSSELNLGTENLILNGLKIMLIQCNGVRTIDSLNFLLMQLKQMTAAFELGELRKGD